MKAGREKNTKLFLLSTVAVLAHTLEGVVSSECGGNVKLSVAMSSISQSTVNCKGNVSPDEDLCGQNVVLLQSTVLREMLDITTDI